MSGIRTLKREKPLKT